MRAGFVVSIGLFSLVPARLFSPAPLVPPSGQPSAGGEGPPAYRRSPRRPGAPPVPRGGPGPRAEQRYTETQKLRAEVESPFAQVRLFALPALLAGAAIATYFAATGLLAQAVGARDPSPDAVTNLVVDLASVGTLGFLWKRELDNRELRLKRIAFGSKLAALKILRLAVNDGKLNKGGVVSLKDLRRGRGQSRRVVIICAPEEALRASLEAACKSAVALAGADFLVVPLLLSGDAKKPKMDPPPVDLIQGITESALSGGGYSSPPQEGQVRTETQPALPWEEAVPDAEAGWPIALPKSIEWGEVLEDDIQQAAQQNPNALARGVAIVLTKTGRVGTRRLGMPDWGGMIQDIKDRERSGLDIVNV